MLWGSLGAGLVVVVGLAFFFNLRKDKPDDQREEVVQRKEEEIPPHPLKDVRAAEEKVQRAKEEKRREEVRQAEMRAAREREDSERRQRETQQLLEKLAKEKAEAEKRIAEAEAAEIALAEVKAALLKAKADGFDLRVLDDPERDYTLEDLKVPVRVRLTGKVRTLRIGRLDAGAILDVSHVQADTIHFTDAITGKARVTLSGTTKVFNIGQIENGAILDAGRLDAGAIAFAKNIVGPCLVKVKCAEGNVIVTGRVEGTARVEIHAPAGKVTFASSGDKSLEGDVRIALTAHDVDFEGNLQGGPHALVVATLTKGGSLSFHSLRGGGRMLWRKADPRDPEPRLTLGIVEPPAVFHEVGANNRPQDLSAKVVNAWHSLGAEPGWLRLSGFDPFFAFRMTAFPDLSTLPMPEVPFGLDLSKTLPGEAGLKQLGRFTRLRVLQLSNAQVTKAGLQELVRLPEVQWLGLSGNLEITDDAMTAIALFEELHFLDLRDTRVTDGGLKELTRLTKLRGLYLYHTGLTDAGLKSIGSLENLQFLDLSRTGISDAGLQELSGLKQLRVLDLYRVRVTDLGLKELAKIDSLQDLNLAARRVTDEGMKDLGKLKNLRRLNLQAGRVTDAGIKHLLTLSKLEALNLAGTLVTDVALVDLARLPNLRVLDLTGLPVTERGVASFRAMRKDCALILKKPEVAEENRLIGNLRGIDPVLQTITVALAPDRQEKTFPLLIGSPRLIHAVNTNMKLQEVPLNQAIELQLNEFEEVSTIHVLLDRRFPSVSLPELQWSRNR